MVIRIDRYEFAASAGVNVNAVSPEYAIDLDDQAPIYEFRTSLTVFGTGTEPEGRAGHKFELSMEACRSPSRELSRKLADIHVRGKYGEPAYRKYRGREIPVYENVLGIAPITKTRGEDSWTA